MPTFERIGNSVGDPNEGAVNRDNDVKTVRGLLNVQIIRRGSGDTLLPILDRVDRDMLKAISEFQRRQGLPQAQLIEPDDKTDRALRQFNSPSNMRPSSRAIDFIKEKEGLRLHLYDDHYGNITIGWGHFVHSGKLGSDPSSERPFASGISETQAEQLLREDLRKKAEEPVNDRVRVPLTQGQFDALVSLRFNLSQGIFEDSKLLKALNSGDYIGAEREFADFAWAHHRYSSGLASRRQDEERFFHQR